MVGASCRARHGLAYHARRDAMSAVSLRIRRHATPTCLRLHNGLGARFAAVCDSTPRLAHRTRWCRACWQGRRSDKSGASSGKYPRRAVRWH